MRRPAGNDAARRRMLTRSPPPGPALTLLFFSMPCATPRSGPGRGPHPAGDSEPPPRAATLEPPDANRPEGHPDASPPDDAGDASPGYGRRPCRQPWRRRSRQACCQETRNPPEATTGGRRPGPRPRANRTGWSERSLRNRASGERPATPAFRPRALRDPCDDARRGWRAPRGSASAAGSHGSSPGGGCWAERSACSRLAPHDDDDAHLEGCTMDGHLARRADCDPERTSAGTCSAPNAPGASARA